MITDRDFRNVLQILDFSLRHNSFPNHEILVEITNELLDDYEHNGYRMSPQNQEHFVNLAKKVYKNMPKKWDKVVDISIKHVRTEATNLKILCYGLEMFETLDIVKHESRRLLLGKIKSIIDKDMFKIREIIYLISLYPSKIRTRAFEQLIELALNKIIGKNLVQSVDYQVMILTSLTKSGISERIQEIIRPLLNEFLNKNDHSNKVLNMLLDHCCVNFSKMDATNHIFILKFFEYQKELPKIQRELLVRYASMVASELKYGENE